VTPFSYNPPSSAPIEIDGYQSAPDEQPTDATIFQIQRGLFFHPWDPVVADAVANSRRTTTRIAAGREYQ